MEDSQRYFKTKTMYSTILNKLYVKKKILKNEMKKRIDEDNLDDYYFDQTKKLSQINSRIRLIEKKIIKYESIQRIKKKKEEDGGEDCIILKKAIDNYIKFYGNSRPFPTRNILKKSSAGIKGWAEANFE